MIRITRSLAGMAKPMPLVCFCGRITAALIPTTSPLMSNSGPPELPGLIWAVVWIRSL